MYSLIQSQEDYKNLINEMLLLDDISGITIIPLDQEIDVPPSKGNLSLLFINFLNKSYIISITHPESCYLIDKNVLINDLQSIIKTHKILVFNKISFLHYIPIISENIIDVNLWVYLKNQQHLLVEKLSLDERFTFFKNKYYRFSKVNNIIPIGIHIDYLNKINSYINSTYELMNKEENFSRNNYGIGFNFYNNGVCNVIYRIEKQGIKVNGELFNDLYNERVSSKLIENEKLYTSYNLFTKTGRPSNTNNGLNLLALNKKDSSREIIYFDENSDRLLMEIDFKAHHLQIMAELINYRFPEGIEIYDYLGKIYFDKENLTEEDYKESKIKSFQILYSSNMDLLKEYAKKDEFFEKMVKYLSNINEKLDTDIVLSPISNRIIRKNYLGEESNYKILNYFLQLIEFELCIILMDKIQEYLNDKDCKLIMYCYDSMLFDCSKEEITNIKTGLVDLINNLYQKRFPISIKVGNNYKYLFPLKN